MSWRPSSPVCIASHGGSCCWVFMECLVISVKVLHDFWTTDRKTTHENLVHLVSGRVFMECLVISVTVLRDFWTTNRKTTHENPVHLVSGRVFMDCLVWQFYTTSTSWTGKPPMKTRLIISGVLGNSRIGSPTRRIRIWTVFLESYLEV